ncbi:hypothetical protein [Streptomyces sp. I05A-00742]|uniref:ATP-binding protein n=1 Tax=Streptomyces sp. I05A-00742 TaxID=2732853 RepID=UPI001489E781|nr:hypothetical protein [Streptomyces sp. I05A-00742]
MSTARLSPRPADPGPAATPTYRFSLPARATTPRLARDVVRVVLNADHATLVDDARLCVSDAVTAVLSGTASPHVHVDVFVDRDRVVLAVLDADRTRDGRRRPSSGEALRLPLVRRLSAASGVTWEWDAEHRVMGRRVWFALDGSTGTSRTDSIM